MKGKRELPECRYKDKGRTAWSRTIKDSARLKLIRKTSEEEEENKEKAKEREQTRIAEQKKWQREEGPRGSGLINKESSKEFLQCGKCGYHVLADRKAFDLNNLGVKTWCNRCKKSWEVKSWVCRCRSPWHQCEVHKNAPQAMREAKETKKGEQRRTSKEERGTERGKKRTLEEAESRSTRKPEKTKPEHVSFSAKECAAASARVRRLLKG